MKFTAQFTAFTRIIPNELTISNTFLVPCISRNGRISKPVDFYNPSCAFCQTFGISFLRTMMHSNLIKCLFKSFHHWLMIHWSLGIHFSPCITLLLWINDRKFSPGKLFWHWYPGMFCQRYNAAQAQNWSIHAWCCHTRENSREWSFPLAIPPPLRQNWVNLQQFMDSKN